MPIYEYECSACGSRTEILQRIGEAPLKVCEQCGKSSMRKLVSPTGFRLGGSGWYETDFKSGKRRNVASSGDESSAGSSSDPSGGKTENKAPAKAKEPAPAATD